MPVPHAILAQPPAEPRLLPAHEGGEVEEPRGNVAEDDAALVQPGDVGLHLVDEAAHPQAQASELGVVAVRRLRGDCG